MCEVGEQIEERKNGNYFYNISTVKLRVKKGCRFYIIRRAWGRITCLPKIEIERK
jgi:hypothetical protein